MKAWLIKIGEGARGGRPYRIDMLAQALENDGHDILLWTSTFDHIEKRHLYDADVSKPLSEHFRATFIHSPGYRRNVSVGRLWDHHLIARRFRELAQAEEQKPDLIFCCLPTLDLCREAVAFGRTHGVPVVIDVRDLWPDVFLTPFPSWGRAPARFLLSPVFRAANATLSGAAGITAVSEEYLQWGLGRAGRTRGPNDAAFPLSFTPPAAGNVDREVMDRELADCGVDLSLRLCVFAGTLGSTYDIETILECARVLAREPRYHDVRVVICGDGDKRHLMTALPANVVYTGWLSQEHLQCLMERARLGFLSYTRSALQSLPNKVYEYMAAGVAIVSSLDREAKDLIDRCGCGVSYRAESVTSMTGAVMALLDDDARCRLCGQNGRIAYQREFRPEAIYPRMSRHLEKVALSSRKLSVSANGEKDHPGLPRLDRSGATPGATT